MSQASDRALSLSPRYYEIRGRAAEIAWAFGSRVGGAEHLFLAMLHDGGWPVSVISRLVDLGQAEAAVLGIVNSPGYSPPQLPRLPARDGFVQIWGGQVAAEMGDSHIGTEHAFLAMIRNRETIPARVLADLADLHALEVTVLDARNAASAPPEDAVFLPEGRKMDSPLRSAIINALPETTTFAFNHDKNGRTWMDVTGPGGRLGPEVTREVLNTALASLGLPT